MNFQYKDERLDSFGNNAANILKKEFPKIVKYFDTHWSIKPPSEITLIFDKTSTGIAATAGTTIFCNTTYYKQLKPGDYGSLIHEMIHVIQGYGDPQPGYDRVPGFLVEGIPDFYRYFIYEPGKIQKPTGGNYRDGNGYANSAYLLKYIVTVTKDREGRYKNPENVVQILNFYAHKNSYKNSLIETYTQKSFDTWWNQMLRDSSFK